MLLNASMTLFTLDSTTMNVNTVTTGHLLLNGGKETSSTTHVIATYVTANRSVAKSGKKRKNLKFGTVDML